jgi:prepilin-type N-terminal cleavage/methylation domain-containing protein
MNYPTTLFEHKLRSKGFTLIELLVVVAIISLLSSVVLASVRDAREKAQKSALIQSIYQVQLALEVYKTNNGYYPYETTQPEEFYIQKGVEYYYDYLNPAFTTNELGEEPFIPKYISKFPEPLTIGTSGYLFNQISYMNISTVGDGLISCGSNPIKGYVLYYYDFYDNGINLPVATYLYDPASGIHCVTAN